MGMFTVEQRAPKKAGKLLLVNGYWRIEWTFEDGTIQLSKYGSKSKKAMKNIMNNILGGFENV